MYIMYYDSHQREPFSSKIKVVSCIFNKFNTSLARARVRVLLFFFYLYFRMPAEMTV